MNVNFHKRFIKSYAKLSVKLRRAVDEKLEIFEKNPFFRELNNHALTGRYQGYRSVDITGDYRAIYQPVSKNEVLFVKVGTHSKLYG